MMQVCREALIGCNLTSAAQALQSWARHSLSHGGAERASRPERAQQHSSLCGKQGIVDGERHQAAAQARITCCLPAT